MKTFLIKFALNTIIITSAVIIFVSFRGMRMANKAIARPQKQQTSPLLGVVAPERI